jgi:hypothetical protein
MQSYSWPLSIRPKSNLALLKAFLVHIFELGVLHECYSRKKLLFNVNIYQRKIFVV